MKSKSKYLFKSSHLLLDSVYKSPLYYKTKKKQNSSFFHMSEEKHLRYIYSSWKQKIKTR